MDSFLRCHQHDGAVAIPGGADVCVKLWARSVEPLGLIGVPRSEAEMCDAIARFEDQLTVSSDTREVIRWLRRPPLPFIARMPYHFLFQAALATLPPRLRHMIGVRAWPRWLVVPPTRIFLRALRWLIGPEDPLQDAARERIRRSCPANSGDAPSPV